MACYISSWMLLRENVPLAPYTTFRIGGPARWFAEPESEADVGEAVRFARDSDLPLFVLGGGSNLLVADEGFSGLVLHMAVPGIEQDGSVFRVGAGEEWDRFVSLAVEQRFGGVECLAGIPGTVGGTPVQNVGAYGQEVAETIILVRALDLHSMRFAELSAAECGFSYRRSIFNSSHRGQYIVTRVDYSLRQNAAPVLAYADLKRHFSDYAGVPSLAETVSAVRAIRRGKGMLLVEGDPDSRSAGSFFKNPIVSRDAYSAISSAAKMTVPSYPALNGQVKLPAAWLIERAGFPRGFVLGKAGISSRHSLALINRGGATANDILALRDRIRRDVQEQFGVVLESEPVWLSRGERLS